MSNLLPRVYQAEAAREALSGNRIIRADTGTGKTLIAILLLKAVTATSDKFAVFLSPNVALVYQQAAAIEQTTHLKVKTFVGSDGVDYWKRERWIEQISSCDVGVMTPQVFLNLCDNAYWSFERISVIIFDECHNCSKNHPSAVVMRNHYHPLKLRDPALLPRILGLTASPIYNVKRPEKTISELEATLDARILEITTTASFSRKAEERLVEHSPLGLEPTLRPSDATLLARLAATGRLDERALARAPACELLFGRLGLDIYLSLLAEECGVLELSSPPCDASAHNLSSKVTALINCLETFQAQPHFHAIVFVQQRHQAKILSRILSLIPTLHWVKAGFLTGHGGKGSNSDGDGVKGIGMEIKEQQETVKKFRNEELNLLVATRVAEEGLDFQACNVVVRFDSLETITGYIQSRGRARAASALFVVIAEAGSEDAERYKRYVVQEEELKTLYADRPEEDLEEPELDNLPTYSTSTGALLTFKNSIPLLATFCSLLNRHDPFTPTQKPIYRYLEGQAKFRYELVVPKMAALSRSTFVSDTFPTKKAARQQTAFDCCVALHKAGALDDYLLPVRETLAAGAKDAMGRDVDRTPSAKRLSIPTPNPFGNVWTSESAVLHVVEIADSGGTRRLGLVCGTRQLPLDDGHLSGRAGDRVKVRIVEVKELNWGAPQERDARLRQLESFNRLCVRIQLNRRFGDDDRFYALWAPLTDTNDVNYSLVDSAFLPFDPSSAGPESLIVVPLRRPHQRIGRFVRVRSDVDSSSTTAEIVTGAPRGRRALIEKYSPYARYLKVCYDFDGLREECPESIVEFESIPFPSYSLGENPEPSQALEKHELRIFPASMCRISTLSLDFWDTFAMIPALNRLISTRTVANLAMDRLQLPPIDVEHLSRALTTPHSRVGFDYEYLETLGDSFLKLATSIHIYLEYAKSEEGRLTILRQNSVDNRFLRQQCSKTGLASFIQSVPFRRATFVPESSDDAIVSPDGTELTRSMSRKVLSDVVEATLGAAVLSGGVEMALETGERLGLCFGGTTDWANRSSARTIIDVESSEVASSLKFIEEAMGYKIKSHGRLLLQALTHRSYPGDGYCYEREEYLGDAVLDWWATVRLFPLTASTTPRFLTFRRAMLVSNPTLALLAIRKLAIHKSILHNSPLLETALREAAEYAEKIDWSDVVAGDLIWVWSPPKVLGDVFEALLAVVFIDSGFNLEAVFAVLDKVYEDVLPSLTNEHERRDPYSRLLMWRDSRACKEFKISHTRSDLSTELVATPSICYTSTVTFHSHQIATQTVASKSVARQLAARQALALLEGDEGVKCDCKAKKEKEKAEKLDTIEAERLMQDTAIESSENEDAAKLAEAADDGADLLEEVDDEERADPIEPEAAQTALPGRLREY
ncbi:hypothetical protein JCM11491_006536 [Sporobolomyces phaffii]